MGITLNIGLVIALLSLSGFSRVSNIKFQALSYYAAESGTEASLYKVRKSGEDVGSLDAVASQSDLGTSWQSSGQIATQAIQEDLEQDKSLVLYLYNPEIWQCGISLLQLTWQDTCSNNSLLEVAQISPIADQTEFDNLNWSTAQVQGFFRGDPFVIANNGTVFLYLNSSAVYVIKITAKDCYVNYLKIEGKDSSGNAVLLNTENIITSTGSAGDIKQSIRVSM
jgi:hypothetical protein